MPTHFALKPAIDDPRDVATALAVEACAEAHRRLGPGLPRDTYKEALCHELRARGIPFQRQVTLPVFYRGVRLDAAYRIDVCVSASVAVEVRAVEAISRVHRAELRAKLRASGLGSGVLVNFHTARFGEGLVIIRRSARRAARPLGERVLLLEQPTVAGRDPKTQPADERHALSRV
jgi:GxxExxY protein